MTSSRRPFGIEQRPLAALGCQQLVGAVQGHAAIVADDPAAAIGVGQAGDDVAPPAGHDLRRIGIEDAVIVGLAILGEGLVHDRVWLETGGLQPGLDHAQPAIGHDGAAERRVGLQPDDHLVVAINVARLVGSHGGGRLGIDVEDALADLLLEVGLQLRPDGFRPFARRAKKASSPS